MEHIQPTDTDQQEQPRKRSPRIAAAESDRRLIESYLGYFDEDTMNAAFHTVPLENIIKRAGVSRASAYRSASSVEIWDERFAQATFNTQRIFDLSALSALRGGELRERISEQPFSVKKEMGEIALASTRLVEASFYIARHGEDMRTVYDARKGEYVEQFAGELTELYDAMSIDLPAEPEHMAAGYVQQAGERQFSQFLDNSARRS